MLRVGPLDEAHVQVQPGGERQLVEETRRDVGREPADALVREIDVRDEAGRYVALECPGGERLVRGGQPPPPAPRWPQQTPTSAPPRPAWAASSPLSAAPSARPAAATASSALPGATSSDSLNRAVAASSTTRWSSTGKPVATLAAPSRASSTRTPVCVSVIAL